MATGWTRMLATGLIGAVLAAASAPSASAETLPTLALAPAPTPSIWHGLSVGAELVAVSAKGGGGIGGDVFAGYSHEFANNIVLGLRGSTGYMPGWGASKIVRGYDFAATDVLVGYDMGRLMPFVTAGVALARPHWGADLSAAGADSLNQVLNGAHDTRALTRVGAGFDYALTNNLTVGFAVSAVQQRGPLLLP